MQQQRVDDDATNVGSQTRQEAIFGEEVTRRQQQKWKLQQKFEWNNNGEACVLKLPLSAHAQLQKQAIEQQQYHQQEERTEAQVRAQSKTLTWKYNINTANVQGVPFTEARISVADMNVADSRLRLASSFIEHIYKTF